MPLQKLSDLSSSKELFVNLTLRELRVEVQAVGPRLDLVVAEPADQPGHLRLRLRRHLRRRGPARRPVGTRQLRHVPHVRAAAVQLPVERPERRHGRPHRERQPGQEGLLPARDPGGRVHRVVAGVVPHRAGRARRRPRLLRQRRRPVDPDGAGARGAGGRLRAGPRPDAGGCRRCTSATCSTCCRSCCRSGSTRRRSSIRCRWSRTKLSQLADRLFTTSTRSPVSSRRSAT